MIDPKKILVVHHTVSISTAAVHEAALEGLAVDELSDLEVTSLPALTAR